MTGIRKATREDNKSIAKVLGELITSYYSDIEIKNAIIKELESEALSSNSILFYANCNIFEKDDEVAGVVSFYKGELDKILTQNLTNLTDKYDTSTESHKPQSTVESSTDGIIPKGIYLSMVSVLPKFQGQKLGQELIKSVENSAKEKGFDRVSIKVDMYNPRAEELYKRLGYKYIDEYIANGVTLKYLEKMLY